MTTESTLAKVRLSDGLGPLPEADGTAEANKKRHPAGGYTFDEVPAWSEPLVRAYAAEQVAEDRVRQRAVIADDAFAATFQSIGQYRTALLRLLCRA